MLVAVLAALTLSLPACNRGYGCPGNPEYSKQKVKKKPSKSGVLPPGANVPYP